MKLLINSLGVLILVLAFSCAGESANNAAGEGSRSSSSSSQSTSTAETATEETKELTNSELSALSREEKLEYLRKRSEGSLDAEKRAKLNKIRAEQNQMKQDAVDEAAAKNGIASASKASKSATESSQVDLAEEAKESTFARDLMSFVEAGKMDKRRRFVLDQVSFDQNENLNPNSNRQIQVLKEIMDKYPRLNVGFLGYSNKKLVASEVTKITERRGKKLADLLVSKGILGNRLGYQGLGKSPAGVLDPERIEVVVMGL